jgi:UPF0176 protein
VGRILNIAAYKFVALREPAELAALVRERAGAAELVGTVLLAEEGINLFLAGEPHATRAFVSMLRSDARFADLDVKESWSARPPFRRLVVKVKREIIRMNRPAVRPQEGRAPAIAARDLKRWLDRGADDEGRPVVMLDTRNAFEVDAGRFDGAVDWRLSRFGDFADAFARRAGELDGKTVVSYCTGGIRCEKAAILMRASGFDRVYQLDGGILKYLEETGAQGAPHWRGECFVFDARVALDARLQPADVAMSA